MPHSSASACSDFSQVKQRTAISPLLTHQEPGNFMKLAYVTAYDAQNIDKWSGLGAYIAQSLKNESITLDYIGPLKENFACKVIRKYKSHYYGLLHKKYLRDPEPFILKSYAAQILQKIQRLDPDIVFSPTSVPISYLESERPIAFWADATFAGLVDFYPHYSNLCYETIQYGHRMEALALKRCKLAIYASDWAAKTAIDYYKTDPAKVKVVPFGANLDIDRNLEEVKDLVEARSLDTCKLLFLGVDWFRKGGDVALAVTKELNQSGLKTELTIVGCQPATNESIPNYVKPLGYISKSTLQGKEKINRLLAETHFLIVPSRAECYGLVFCEASSFGVPSLAVRVGGIPTIIKDDINGYLLDPSANIAEYCQRITDLFVNYSKYKSLALSSFHEYQTRLNWSTAGRNVKNLLLSL